MQTSLFDIHFRENNAQSQALLEECRPQIIKSCQKVLDLMMDGNVLTVKDAVKLHDISSLPRRALDLIESGIKVQRKLVGKTTHYYLERDEILRLRNMV